MLRRLSILLAAGTLVLAIGASTALASGGSAYVTSGCDYTKSLQDNTIDQQASDADSNLYVWIKLTGDNTDVGQWSTVDNSGQNVQWGDLIAQECTTFGPKYVLYLADGFDSSVLGSYTLTAWQGDAFTSAAISGDGFRVVEPPV